MSKYSEVLKEYIERSKLSLSEIETELRKKGYNKNKSYLSNLQNGKVEPPSSAVNFALSEVIGADPIRLVTIPLIESMNEKNSEVNQSSFITYLVNLFFSMYATLVDLNKESFYEYVVTYFDDKIEREDFINSLSFDVMKGILKDIPQEEILKILIPQVNIAQISNENATQLESNTSELYVSSEEEEYLIECLEVYRKLKLKPNK